MLTLNDSSTVKKANTGPNPQKKKQAGPARAAQTAKNTTGYTGYQGPATPTNQGVTAPGAQPVTPVSQPPAAEPAQPTPAAAPPTYDYTTDPILQQIMASQQMAISQAQAQALAQQKQTLIAYGDPGLAMSLLNDKLTADAAAGNSTSTLAQLAAANASNVRGTNSAENKANLFYSSDRGYQLGLAQQAYLQNQSDASNAVQGTLGGISANLLAAEQAAWNAEAQAQEDAYNRALQHPVGVPQPQPVTGGGTPQTPSSDQGGGGDQGQSSPTQEALQAGGPVGGVTSGSQLQNIIGQYGLTTQGQTGSAPKPAPNKPFKGVAPNLYALAKKKSNPKGGGL